VYGLFYRLFNPRKNDFIDIIWSHLVLYFSFYLIRLGNFVVLLG